MQTLESTTRIAKQLGIAYKQVANTINLLQEACTTPFIARYRKELTGGLDEVQIEEIRQLLAKFTELEKRKISILQTIKSQGQLTPALAQSIEQCWDEYLLEDLYLPYKQKRKTKASVAKEKGLEPLAHWLMRESNENPESAAIPYLKNGITTVQEALQGARDIIAEMINENTLARATIRNQFQRYALVQTKMVKGKEIDGQKYRDYFSYEEPLNKCPSHRLLAVFRGEEEGFIKVSIEPNQEQAILALESLLIKRNTASSMYLELAVKDAYKRLLSPSLENETRAIYKAKADDEAIKVFSENLKQLLLAAPLGSKRILAIDPGFRSGCKVVCLNQEGGLEADEVIYPHEPQREVQKAEMILIQLVEKYNIQAFAIGNGTAGRETENFVRGLPLKVSLPIYMVNENGASVYSASAVAREEFPDKDLTVRGAVSIGRRLADPLAELVKIEAKAIGVGQYQHDVDQAKLKQSLDQVVQNCVNLVGVNVNTASKSLLTYVSGLNEQSAKNIIQFREENGAFKSRAQLKKVPRLGPKAFEQCAAFLRIPSASNVLDNSAVHPERYALLDQIASRHKCTVADLVQNEGIRKNINVAEFVSEEAGLVTLQDIMKELAKPGRDPRETLVEFQFADVKKPEDLYVGMVLPGIVTNITRFGCFVDIGVKQDGMVHISQLANRYISDPNTVVKLQQQVQVKVLEVDLERKRIGLSLRLE
jgi:uncharacterized protein